MPEEVKKEEVKETKEEQPKFISKIVKKDINAKKLLMYSLTALVPISILIMTWIPFIFDIRNLNVQKWITTSLINVGISIASIVLGEILGDEKQREKVGGMFQLALTRFDETLKRLKSSGMYLYFSQFFIWFKAKELKNMKESFLVDHNVDQLQAHFIVEYAELEDLDRMKASSFKKIDEKTGKEIPFKKITEEQYELMKFVFSTEFVMETYDYTYYLSANNDGTAKSILLRAKALDKKDKSNKTFRRVFKISLYIFISFLMGMAAIQEMTAEGVKEAAMNTNTRLIAFVSGLLSGFLTAVISVKIAAEKLNDKSDIQDIAMESYQNKDFVPKTYEELVEEAIEEEEKEKEEALKNIVTPEVVEGETPLMIGTQEDTDSKGE